MRENVSGEDSEMQEVAWGLARIVVGASLLVSWAWAADAPYTFSVKHLHKVDSCNGRLVITDTGVNFDSDYRKDARHWEYRQIKNVTRDDTRRLVIETYEDQSSQLGRDKIFRFEVMAGEISNEVYKYLMDHVLEPPANHARPVPARQEIPAKHLHSIGGCEGSLIIREDALLFATDNTGDARTWHYTDIKRIERNGPYRFAIYTYEDQATQLGRDKVFRFELKQPMDQATYDSIRSRMNR